MPDVTLCTGGECPMKFNCYRFMAMPTNPWQSHFAAIPEDKGYCQYHLPMNEKKVVGKIRNAIVEK